MSNEMAADFARDLDEMFSDMDEAAVIDGQVVTGWFDSGDSSFMDAAVPTFEAPTARLDFVRRGVVVQVNGQQYRVSDIAFLAGRIRLTLAMG